MAGGAKGAAKSIQSYVESSLKKAADSGAIGRKSVGRSRAPVDKVVRNTDWENTPAEEVRELLSTDNGRKKLLALEPKDVGAVRSKLYDQNRLWGEQFDDLMAGRGETPAPLNSGRETAIRTGGNDDYDMPDRAKEAVGTKLKREGGANETRDIRSTTRAVEGVTDAARAAEQPLPSSTNRRSRGSQEAARPAGASPLEIDPAFQRGNAAGAPRGSETIAGGDDGSKALPVGPKAADDISGLGEVEKITREAEIDPKSPKASMKTLEITTSGGKTITGTPTKLEGRSRDSRTPGPIGGRQASGTLARSTTAMLEDVKTAPVDFVYRAKDGDVSIKAGDRITPAQARQLLIDQPEVFQNFVGKGLADRDFDLKIEAQSDLGSTGRKRPGYDDDEAIRKPFRQGAKQQVLEATADSERRRQTAANAAGNFPNAPGSLKELTVEEMMDGGVAASNGYTRTGGRSTQDPSARLGNAEQSVLTRFPDEGHAFLDAVRGASTPEEAYEHAFRIGEEIVDGEMPGERISASARQDAIHGIAETLTRGYGHSTPVEMPSYVASSAAAARQADIASGHTQLTRTKAPVENGPKPTTRDFLRGRAFDRADARIDGVRNEPPGLPRAGAPVGPVEFPLRPASESGLPVRGHNQQVEGGATVGSTDAGEKSLLPSIPAGGIVAPTPKAAKKSTGRKAAAPPVVPPTTPSVAAAAGGDDLPPVPAGSLLPGRQTAAGATAADRAAAVRDGWSADERLARTRDQNVAAGELADDLSELTTEGPTDAELAEIAAEQAAAAQKPRAAASTTPEDTGPPPAAAPSTPPPSQGRRGGRPAQPPVQVADKARTITYVPGGIAPPQAATPSVAAGQIAAPADATPGPWHIDPLPGLGNWDPNAPKFDPKDPFSPNYRPPHNHDADLGAHTVLPGVPGTSTPWTPTTGLGQFGPPRPPQKPILDRIESALKGNGRGRVKEAGAWMYDHPRVSISAAAAGLGGLLTIPAWMGGGDPERPAVPPSLDNWPGAAEPPAAAPQPAAQPVDAELMNEAAALRTIREARERRAAMLMERQSRVGRPGTMMYD